MRILEMLRMKPDEFKQALPFEAQRYLPFNIQEVVMDGAVLGPSDGNKVWVLLVACKKSLLERRVDWAKRAGLSADLIDVDALALANAFLAAATGEQLKGTRALIDVGGQLTNLVILRGGVPYLVRDIPWGGDKLTRNIAEQLGTDPEAVSQALAQGQPSAEMLNALKLSSAALASELQLSFDYFENRFNQPPEEILVTGGLSHSTPFLEGLKAHLAQAVTQWTPVQGLPPQFAVAYGLALRTA
jgi:type IV pilus assembly protein PilM